MDAWYVKKGKTRKNWKQSAVNWLEKAEPTKRTTPIRPTEPTLPPEEIKRWYLAEIAEKNKRLRNGLA
jgi:hypothetical protein